MTEKKIGKNIEDSIKDIHLSLEEVISFCNILLLASSNDADKPGDDDIKNSTQILINFVENLKSKTEHLIGYCEEKGIFTKSESEMPKA